MTDPADIVETTIGGKTFRCSRRTEAHLVWTVDRLAADHPDCRLVVIQGCYNTGVAASAGTHDYDAVLDVAIVGLDWLLAQRWLREHGWAAWYRYPPTFSEHIHMVSLGYPGQVGVYVPGQVRDYLARPPRNGLAGHAPDTTWHPPNIDATYFDYPAWLDQQAEEHDMTPDQDARQKRIEDKVDKILTKANKQRDRDLFIIRLARQSQKTEDQILAEVDDDQAAAK